VEVAVELAAELSETKGHVHDDGLRAGSGRDGLICWIVIRRLGDTGSGGGGDGRASGDRWTRLDVWIVNSG
jgi:hypothetical protein